MYFCLKVDEESDFLFFRANFSELLLLIVSYVRSLPVEVICYSYIILLVCVVPEVSNWGSAYCLK